MSKPQDTSTAPTNTAIDPSAQPEQIVQPIQQQPLVDSFAGAPIGDDTVNNPNIINR